MLSYDMWKWNLKIQLHNNLKVVWNVLINKKILKLRENFTTIFFPRTFDLFIIGTKGFMSLAFYF